MARRFIILAGAISATALLSMSPARADSECEANFTSANSNSLLGLLAPTTATYQSHATLHGVSASDGFTRAYREIVSDGFTIASSDREAGAITATMTGNGGENHIALTLLMDERGDDLGISVKITASAGGMGHAVRHVCGPISAAQGSPTSD